MSIPISSLLNPADEPDNAENHVNQSEEVTSSEASTEIISYLNSAASSEQFGNASESETAYPPEDEANRVHLTLGGDEVVNANPSNIQNDEEILESDRNWAYDDDGNRVSLNLPGDEFSQRRDGEDDDDYESDSESDHRWAYDEEGNRVSLYLSREEDLQRALHPSDNEPEDDDESITDRQVLEKGDGEVTTESDEESENENYEMSENDNNESNDSDEGNRSAANDDRAPYNDSDKENDDSAEASMGVRPIEPENDSSQTPANNNRTHHPEFASLVIRQQGFQTTASGPRKLAKHPRNSPTPEPGDEAGPSPRKSAKTSGSTMTPGTARAKRSRSSYAPDADTHPHKLAKTGRVPPPLVLSPSKSNIYNRRQSTSPTRVPILETPRKRDPRVYNSSPVPSSHEISLGRFSVFNVLLKHPELILEVSKHLHVHQLASLYSISKDFHYLINDRMTTVIMTHALGKASESARTFVHRCYKNLCMRDPGGRTLLFTEDQSENRQSQARDTEIRYVPSFRWLRMVLFREAVVDSILACLAAEGHRMPKRSSLVIKKLWFTLDISDNARRIGLLHNERFWTNKDLFVVTMFFVKLDMRFTDPTVGDGDTEMKRMLLGQKSLSTLAAVLRGEELTSQLELLRMMVQFDHVPSRPIPDEAWVFGIPGHEVGKLCLEGWGKGSDKFYPIDDLVMREGVKRKLNLQNHYVDMMLYGYVNKKTFEDIRTVVEPEIPVGEDDKSDDEIGELDSSDEEESQRERAQRMGLFEGETEDEDEDEGDVMEQVDEEGEESFASNAIKETEDEDMQNISIAEQ